MSQCPSCGGDCGRPGGVCGYSASDNIPKEAFGYANAKVEAELAPVLLPARQIGKTFKFNAGPPYDTRQKLDAKAAMKLAKQAYSYTSSELTTAPIITMTAGNLVRFFELASKEYKP